MTKISAQLKQKEVQGFFGTSQSQRLEVTDLVSGKTVSIAAHRLNVEASQVPPNLNFFTLWFWEPVKVVHEGKEEWVLINRSSFKKRISAEGFSHIRGESLRSQKFEDIFTSLVTNKLKTDFFKNNPEFNKLNLQQKIQIELAIERFVKDPLKFFPAGQDVINEEFGHSFKVTIESKFNHDARQREVTLKIADKEGVLFAKASNRNFHSKFAPQAGANSDEPIAQDAQKRKNYFNALFVLPEDGAIKLTSVEKAAIVNYLIQPRFHTLTNHVVGPRAPLLEHEIEYPLELNKSVTGLARTIVILSKDKIMIVSSKKRGDRVIGAGSYKTMKTAVDAVSGKTFACCNKTKKGGVFGASREAVSADEIRLRQRMKDKTGITKLTAVTEGKVIEELYDHDLDKIGSLSYRERVGMLPSMFQGLKELHDEGYIHRDIKPANILVKKTETGRYVAHISDLGLAVEKTSGHCRLWAGTDKYMPPDYKLARTLDDGEALTRFTDEKMDIYALGLTLKEMFAGKIAFSVSERASEPVTPQTTALKELILKMCDKNHSRRASWAEIEAMLPATLAV